MKNWNNWKNGEKMKKFKNQVIKEKHFLNEIIQKWKKIE
jgi:hypothetical protein